MAALLDGLRVVDSRHGRSVVAYMRAEAPIEVRIDHLYSSRRMGSDQASRVASLLKNYGIDATKHPSGNAYVVQVWGQRGLGNKIKRIDPNNFRNLVGSDQSLKLRFPTYSIVEPFDGGLRYVRYSTREECDGDLACFDIEMEKLGTKNYINIPMSTVVKGDARKKTTDFIVVQDANPGGFDCCSVDVVKDQHGISEKTGELLLSAPFAAAHHIPYDASRLRDHVKLKKSDRPFTPSIDGTQPRIKSWEKDGFLKIVRMPGKSWFDTCAFSRAWLPLPRDKLPDVYNYFFPEDPFKKDLSYGELEELMQKRDPESLRRAAIYNIEDTERLFKLAMKVKEIGLPTARAMKTDLTSICSVAQSANASSRWAYDYFHTLNTYRFDRRFTLGEFEFKDEKMGLMERCAGLDRSSFERIGEKNGLHHDVLLVYPLFALNSLPRIRDMETNDLVRLMRSSPAKEAAIYAEALDSMCEEPLFDLLCCRYPEEYHPDLVKLEKERVNDELVENVVKRANNWYVGSYGENPEDTYRKLSRSVRESLATINQNGFRLLNFSNRFLFLEGDGSLEWLEDCPYFLPFAFSSDVISAGRGEAVARVDISLITSGMDVMGRHGLNCELARQALTDYIDKVFSGKKEDALAYVIDLSKKISDMNVPLESLGIKIKRHRPVYSERSQGSERVKVIEALNLKVGEETRYYYSKGRKFERMEKIRKDDVDAERYLDALFGPETAAGRSFNEGSLGRYIAAIELRNGNMSMKSNLSATVGGRNSSLLEFS
ncbi:MAG: hypothetical protein V1887_00420 [Candidatus Aenigmatarchaeota archaeon]